MSDSKLPPAPSGPLVTTDLIVACGVLLVMVVAGFILIAWVRRRAVKDTDETSEGFSFRDMEKMVERGLITPDEFKEIKRARAMKMAKRFKATDDDH